MSTELIEATQAVALPRISPQFLEARKQETSLLQKLVRESLVRDIDFGRIPGTPADSLWDPGANAILNAFNCRVGERRVLSLREEIDRLSVILEVPIISRDTGKEVGSGIGAASTLETKHKYRWVSEGDAQQLGYDIGALKQRANKDSGEVECRIRNPEHDELLNTIVKMASKRAEVDAAESLPGVASVLREMFGSKGRRGASSTDFEFLKSRREGSAPRKDDWTWFWGEVARLGFSQEEAHQILGVKSIKDDWVGKGSSLLDAVAVIEARARELGQKLL